MSTPLERRQDETLPALGAGVAGDQVVARAPFAGTVASAAFTPEAAITGDNTNTRTLTLQNRGQAGSATTVVGAIAFTAGNNGVQFDEKAFVMSGTAANLVVAEGDILAVVETVAGTGLANPGGRVDVVFSRVTST